MMQLKWHLYLTTFTSIWAFYTVFVLELGLYIQTYSNVLTQILVIYTFIKSIQENDDNGTT